MHACVAASKMGTSPLSPRSVITRILPYTTLLQPYLSMGKVRGRAWEIGRAHV